MKTPHRGLGLVLTFVLLLISGNVGAQSITIGAFAGSHFCAGDPISVTFTATGTWQHKNAFTLQLSDTGGSFSNGVFTKIGSLADTVAGTFTISSVLPASIAYSPHYRLRVIGAYPYTVSSDNGSDIAIGTANHHEFQKFTAWTINTPITFNLFPANGMPPGQSDTIHWNFDLGATPPSAIEGAGDISSHFSQTTTYSTSGPKTVIATSVSPGGCAVADTLLTYIFDCAHRVIPHNTYVIDKDSDLDNFNTNHSVRSFANFWVNPGVTLTGGELDTIYAEPGATVVGGPGDIVFLKPGASYTGRTASVVVYADGASVDPKFAGGPTLKCSSDYTFDYTNAPPNAAHPLAVKDELAAASITLSPNPTSGMIQVRGLRSENTTVSVFNVLGEVVVVQKNSRASELSLDLSKLASGTYYIRFASTNSVVTKKIVRE